MIFSSHIVRSQEDLERIEPVGNSFIFSELTTLFSKSIFRAVGIKYVISGEENYSINNQQYTLRSGQFLVANKYSEGTVEVQCPELARGLCIDLDHNQLKDVFHVLSNPLNKSLESYSLDDLESPLFLEEIKNCDESKLGSLLESISGMMNNEDEISKGLFYRIAEEIILSQKDYCKLIIKIPSKKNYTKKELYKRVRAAKDIIDQSVYSKVDIPQIARAAGISEYHFFRTFRHCYGISPYKYHLNKRLELANHLLLKENDSIEEITNRLKFSDIQSFSKAFKKQYFVCPSARRSNKLRDKYHL